MLREAWSEQGSRVFVPFRRARRAPTAWRRPPSLRLLLRDVGRHECRHTRREEGHGPVRGGPPVGASATGQPAAAAGPGASLGDQEPSANSISPASPASCRVMDLPSIAYELTAPSIATYLAPREFAPQPTAVIAPGFNVSDLPLVV